MTRLALLLVAVVGAVAACGGPVNSKRAGEACVASSECGVGLLCDSGKHVCAGMGSPVDSPAPDVDGDPGTDAAVKHDAAPTQHDAPRPIDAAPDAPVDAPPDAP